MHILYSSSFFLFLKPHPCIGDWKGPAHTGQTLYYCITGSVLHAFFFFIDRHPLTGPGWPLPHSSVYACLEFEKSPASACHIAGITGLVRRGLFSFMYYVYINELMIGNKQMLIERVIICNGKFHF